ncbi:MAG: hypothetical protein ACK5MA_05575 [Parachlamydiaceae bacterium]
MRYLIFFSLVFASLSGDIDSVTVKWSAQLCQKSCIKQLNERFSKLQGAEKVSIDGMNGVMEIKWKPKAPFSYQTLDWNMRWIGLYMTYVRVKASGTVTSINKNYTLKSKNDGTTFNLIGNADASNPNLAVATNSIFNRPLSQAVIDQLKDAQKKNLTVTVDGSLFEPWRGPPLRLVVDRISVEQPKKNR